VDEHFGGGTVGDNLETYFHHRIKAAYDRYQQERNSGKTGTRKDLMAATEAAKALYHLREHIPPPYAKSWQDVAHACPDYALVRDVTDADKHHHLRDQTRAVSNASQIEERIVITEYRDDDGPYRNAEKRILIKVTNGGERDLLDVLTNVINYWMDELRALGHLSKLPHYEVPTRPEPLPRVNCNNGRIDFEISQSLSYSQSYQLLMYNYEAAKIELVDLTGAELRFSVYKPQYTLDIVATKDASGATLSRSVTFTQEEFEEMQNRGDEERATYLMGLPKVQAAHGQLMDEIRQLENATSGRPT
jgi:hypothetical protein